MKRSWWRTGPPVKHTQPVARPTGGQMLRQAVLLLFLLLIWGGGFYLLFNTTVLSDAATAAALQPTSTPEPTPDDPPTLAVTPTVAASPTVAATNTPRTASTSAAATITATATAAAAAVATTMPSPTVEPTSVVEATTPAPASDGAISFQRDVQSIFNQICVKCHGGEEVKEGLSLKSYAEVMRGSNNGPVVVPGDPENSFLIEQIVKGEMPKRGPKLLPAQIRAITNWVAAGAPDN